jgi:glycosyltransferase involved in cell wall biosynthesis
MTWMTLRVLLASDFFPPFIGGAELQTRVLARGLARRGHSVRVATVWHTGLEEIEQQPEYEVHRLRGLTTGVPWFSTDPTRRFHPPMPDPGITRGLRRLIQRFSPDVIHASGWIGYSCAAARQGSRTPLVLSVRDYGYTCALRTLMHGTEVCDGPALGKCVSCAGQRYGMSKAVGAVGGVFANRALLARNTAAFHCVSQFVETTMRRDFLPATPSNASEKTVTIPDIVIIPNIMEPPNLAAHTPTDVSLAEFERELPAEPFILFVGALQMHKGLAPLLAAYEQLPPRPPLVLLGSVWPDTPHTFPAGVTVLRNVPHPCVMRAWERSLFGVVPSMWPDPLPGTVREAMSKGKPVIASRAGGIVDMVVDGETGLLVPPGDVEALSAAMRRLIDDPELRAQMGEAGQERTENFAAEKILPRFEALYEQLVTTLRAAA